MPSQDRPVVLRCSRCRHDKAACFPRDRAWPYRKCDRCIHFGYDCGPNVPPPVRPARPTDGTTAILPSIREPHYVMGCMLVLSEIKWDDIGLFHTGFCGFDGTGSDRAHPLDTGSPPIEMIVLAMGCLTGKFTRSNMVYYRMWERGGYLRAQERFDELYRAHLPRATFQEAKRLAIQHYTQETLDKQIRLQSEISSRADVEEAVSHILRRGSRWTALVDAVDCNTILLMDQSVHAMSANSIIGDVIESGTMEQFEELKQFLIAPENRMKDTCLRLSGVLSMVNHMAKLPDNSEVRSYLAEAIPDRIADVFGPPMALHPDEIVCLSPSRLQRHIEDIFGVLIQLNRPYSGPPIGPLPEDNSNPDVMDVTSDTNSLLDLEAELDPENLGPTPPNYYAGLSPSSFSDIWRDL